ncbi:sporulation initiation factor Spo0A C-terminal domain-containing protein [Staphylococcus aureus]|uniref:sporulation initiation factor Spo0A C-terminal domain-containing protein n=1 Tax=Staphylococcus aureus TaxID=1280 RepID=UPI001246B4C4|nr:sporulation initiation factor Spo0A C-terminal domain-containing protein [Staphylococcus aureus]
MGHILTILLIEDNDIECQMMTDFINSASDMKLVGVTKDITQGLEYLSTHEPNVIILDLELHYGKGNGLLFLENMNMANVDFTPFVLVTTHNNSQIIHNYARELGADYIIPKYKADYSAQNCIQFLSSLKQIIKCSNKNKFIHSTAQYSILESPKVLQNYNDKIDKILFKEFNQIGISPKMIGRKYLVQAVQLLLEGSTPKICLIISKRYNKTEASVSRAMQNAINEAWCSSNVDNLNEHYTAHIRSERSVPTYMEFIHYYADKIKINS